MALQSIRYGGGVWKQHEEIRVRLENDVASRERELAQCRDEIASLVAANASMVSALQQTQAKCLQLETALSERSQELHAAQQQLCDVARLRLQQQQHLEDVQRAQVASQTRVQQQYEQVRAKDAQIARLEQQVASSLEEEQALCELLYASQETCEHAAMDLEAQTRQVRILTRASDSKSKQIAALDAENRRLAQTLAKVRASKPRVLPPAPRTVLTNTMSYKEDKEQCDDATTTTVIVSLDATTSSSAHGEHQHGKSASFLRRKLQTTLAALRDEQHAATALREQIASLEADQRTLVARFREATAARQRAERKALSCACK